MRVATFTYQKGQGWSVPALPALDSASTLVLAFGCRGDLACEGPIQELVQAYPQSHITGCSTSGEILGETIRDNSLAVAVCCFDSTRIQSTTESISADGGSFAVGKAIARRLAAPDLRGVLVLADGIRTNGTELVDGLSDVLPPSIVVTGGLAGDADRFQSTWVLGEGQRQRDLVSAIGFYGDRIVIGHGSKGGWDVFGPERLVTRSHGNVLYEIDGKSALALYKLYLGDLAVGLPANALLFPLSLRRSRHDETELVRTILSIDEKEGSMTFAGDIPQGSLVRFMRANFDRLVDGAVEAARLAKLDPSSDALAIAISCVGRRLVLGERAEEEVEAVREVLTDRTQIVGFYSYGEISPYSNGRCELHNQTMTLTTLSER